ncbi:MAG: hypothetical protein KGJ24_02150 [Burkholderiales bacterium]|nr:hypothetical protein [Burkholderiales bacterium]
MAALAAALGLAAAPAARAQFHTVPVPHCAASAPSASTDAAAYRLDAAHRLYDCYPSRIYRGRVPPLLYGVMVVEAQIDAAGQLADLSVVRKPAADEVQPWVLALIRGAAPYPAPAHLPGQSAVVVETFFVDRSGLFQVLSLTEGQRDR